MATSKLKKFHVEGEDQTFTLQIEDEGGKTMELSATREQLDVIVDTLDELLSQDDEADEVEDEGD